MLFKWVELKRGQINKEEFMTTTQKILVVDDERNICDSVSKILSRKGYAVDYSLDVEHAIEKIEEVPYHLVILDIMMPKINGMELLKTIRTRHRECNVIMITGYASIKTAVESTQNGALDYIPKPFTPEELLRVVERVLSENPRSEAFCEKGRMTCKKFVKTGPCEELCPIREKKKTKAEVEVDVQSVKGVRYGVMDVDLPFDYDEVASATSDMYAKTLSRSDIPIIGWQKYYEKNNNVLVVDDEVVVCNSVRKVLEGAGYAVDEAHTSDEAVRKLGEKKYALALVDLKLPTIGGIALLKQIKESWPGVRAVIITGYASIGSAVETTKLGALAYIAKPFTPYELSDTVRNAMSQAA